MNNELYIVDVYVPNEGEPESALELSILRLNAVHGRPRVHVHTYIMPGSYHLARIRWSDAVKHGITQDMFRDTFWPTLSDLINADYLKGAEVVCFCSNIEPVQTLVKNSSFRFSILNRWQEVFAGDAVASSFTTCAQMLEYMGLDPEDHSNTGYTASMKRAHAYLAIWSYLWQCSNFQVRPPAGYTTFSQNPYWPLVNVPDPWYQGDPKELTEIPSAALQDYFSDRLPDYVNWSNMCIYGNDWSFGRSRSVDVQLTNQDVMINFIFYKLFNLRTRLLVLAFYSLYNKKTEYARIIALHQNHFNTLKNHIKDDFASFVISHLDDFLTGKQKKKIISALVNSALQSKFEEPEEQLNYTFLKRNADRKVMSFDELTLSKNNSIQWYRQISTKEDVIYRCFTIMGSPDERNDCIDNINEKIGQLLTEAKDPFAQCWLRQDLKEWIEYITGFTWIELARPAMATDSGSLTDTRNTIRGIISERSRPFLRSYVGNFRTVIDSINETKDGEKTTFCFSFMGTTYDIVVDKTDDGSSMFAKWKKKLL